MKLVTHLLEAAGLVQPLVAPKNMSVVAIRPHIVKFNNPSGTLKVQVLSSGDVLLAESATVNISDIGSLAYFHGYIRFYVNVGMQKDTTYKIKLVGGGGYSYSASSFIGWANGYDLGKYDASYSPVNDLYEPLDLEIWERKPKL